MAIEVSRSAGPVVGIAVNTAVPPSAEVCGSLTETIRGIAAMSSVRPGRSAASTPGASRSTTTSSGPLNPVPKPSASRS